MSHARGYHTATINSQSFFISFHGGATDVPLLLFLLSSATNAIKTRRLAASLISYVSYPELTLAKSAVD